MMIRLLLLSLVFSLPVQSQNLVVNPGAEDNPRGTGWTIVSAGPTACAVAPSNTFTNWTMIPDGSGNYPVAHGGTRTFFSGCSSSAPAGPFEIYQDIDVSADAALIDAGNLTTSFSGYIQTPISPQGDAGRFIVDFMTAANVVLGASYTSPYQSFSGGSGNGWINYTNTRIAPVGTRKIRIRMQTTVAVTPAINAYFDDISLTKASLLPLTLVSFKGQASTGHNNLEWTTSQEINTAYFSIQRSETGNTWKEIKRIDAAGNSNSILKYNFQDQAPALLSYYRLKMVDIDDKYSYSHVIKLDGASQEQAEVSIYPNPSGNVLNIRLSVAQPLQLQIVNYTGQLTRQEKLSARNNHVIDISQLRPGFYIIHLTGNSGKKITQGFTKQ
jgi:Secretion system C-terminal sorting domain